MTTMALVRSVIFAARSSTSGSQSDGLVAQVVHSFAAGQRGRRRPQRVVRRGDQHLVPVVEHGLQGELDEFADPVSEPDLVGVGDVDAAGLVVLHDRGPRRKDPLRVRVPLRIGQVADDVDQDLFRGVEPERCRVTDVELGDPVPGLLEALGLLEHRPADVVQDVGELGRLQQFHADQPVTGAGRRRHRLTPFSRMSLPPPSAADVVTAVARRAGGPDARQPGRHDLDNPLQVVNGARTRSSPCLYGGRCRPAPSCRTGRTAARPDQWRQARRNAGSGGVGSRRSGPWP